MTSRKWERGQIVEAQWSDGEWYSAKVTEVLGPSKYRVMFLDFYPDTAEVTGQYMRPSPLISKMARLRAGHKVEIRYTDGIYYQATIKRIDRSRDGGYVFHVMFEGFSDPYKAEDDALRFLKGEYEVGEIVEAIWEEDGDWYDAEVQDFNPDGTYDVEYIGFNENGKLDPSSIRKKEIDDSNQQEEPESSATLSALTQISLSSSQTASTIEDAITENLTPEQKKQKKRKKILDEIVSTEESYVSSIEVLVDLWMSPIERSANRLSEKSLSSSSKSIGEEQPESLVSAEASKLMAEDASFYMTAPMCKTLFSNIKTILPLNKKFLNELQNRGKSIGQLFVQYAPFFKMYTTYVNNFDDASKVLDKAMTDRQFKNFQKFHQDTRNDPRSKDLDLQSYLIMPVQRIPRYKLLLNELINNTEDSDPEMTHLRSAMEKISQVAVSINEDVRNVQNREQIIKLQNKFVGNYQLVSPGRMFVHQGPLTKLSRKETHQNYMFLLFNDLLLYANSLGWKLVLQLDISINAKFKVRDLSFSTPNRMILLSDTKSFIIQSKDEKEKNVWISKFEVVMNQAKMRTRSANPEEEKQREFPEYLALKPLYSWNPEDVSVWLFFNDFDAVASTFYNFHIDGKRLSRLKETNLSQDMGSTDENFNRALTTALYQLLSSRAEEIYSNLKEAASPQSPDMKSFSSISEPQFAKIKDAIFHEDEKDEIKKTAYNIVLSWTNSSGQPVERKIVKTYADFEVFETSYRMKLFPNLPFSLKPRQDFLISLEKRLLLERYLQCMPFGLCHFF
jgi:hypothetical protein